jgi:dTDP-4-amino-4,6-dideoxygalactose transaminase
MYECVDARLRPEAALRAKWPSAAVGMELGLVGGPVPMLDLVAQHAPLEADLSRAALRVLQSGRFIMGGAGSEVAAFEDEMTAACGMAHAVGVSSGTDALVAMLMAIGVGPGDEVITSPFSFIAAAAAVARVGARVVFADIEPDTLTVDPAAVLPLLGPRTKAVIPFHLFGRLANMAPLVAPCAERGIAILEDAAQALGASNADGRLRPGASGLGAALSFFPSKNLGGFGDGGMILTNDSSFAKSLRAVRVHGAVGKFRHETLGGNFRLDELQAALLRVKLPHLPRWTAARRRVAARYRQLLAGTPLGLPPDDPGCVWSQFVVRVPEGRRDALTAHLALRGIGTATYYPEPLHLQPCFAALGHRPGDFPVAEEACRQALAIPLHPDLTDEQAELVARAVAEHYG